jgi:hypothetical protein
MLGDPGAEGPVAVPIDDLELVETPVGVAG